MAGWLPRRPGRVFLWPVFFVLRQRLGEKSVVTRVAVPFPKGRPWSSMNERMILTRSCLDGRHAWQARFDFLFTDISTEIRGSSLRPHSAGFPPPLSLGMFL